MDGIQIQSGFDTRAAAKLGSDPLTGVLACPPRTVWSTGAVGLGLFTIAALLLTGALGCQQVSLIPNSDPALRKTNTEFCRDALKRQPYHADAPQGGKLDGRAVADYGDNTLQIANFSDQDWKNVEVWVNGLYVVYLPTVPGNAASAKTINFEMLYDAMGRPFPNDNKDAKSMVQKVEVFRDGKMYSVAAVPAD